MTQSFGRQPASRTFLMLTLLALPLYPAGAEPGDDATGGSREFQLQQQLDRANARIERLEDSQAELLAARIAQQKLQRLQQRVDQAVQLLRPGQSAPPGSQPQARQLLPWWKPYLLWLVGGVAFVLGLTMGMLLVARRLRRRFGGLDW